MTVTTWWAPWYLKSPASSLFAQLYVRAQVRENIKAPRHWLCEGNSRVTGKLPHKRPATGKISPFDDVIMWWYHNTKHLMISQHEFHITVLSKGNPPTDYSHKRPIRTELGCFLCCWSDQAVEQIVKLPVTSGGMRPLLLVTISIVWGVKRCTKICIIVTISFVWCRVGIVELTCCCVWGLE